MQPYYEQDGITIYHGDCREALLCLASESVDSIVTDPPYELGFMGKSWDRSGIAYNIEVWRECLRVLKPGGHVLAFGGSRTYHRLACAIEDAGFEIRDQIQWIYGQGFPKSLDVSKNLREQGSVCICDECNSNLRGVQNGISDVEGVAETDQDTDVFLSVQRPTTRTGVGETRLQRDGSPRPAEAFSGNTTRLEERRMEGRRDLLSETRELRANQIRSLPAGISSNGSQGRIRDGASPDHGGMDRASANQNGSSSPRRSQSPEQPANKSTSVAGQSQPQTSGAWPLCGRCGKPMVPEGLGSALKPAHEPIVLARKPLTSTLIENVLKHGTGGLNIDGCRIGTSGGGGNGLGSHFGTATIPAVRHAAVDRSEIIGRWPANVIHSGDPEVLAAFPAVHGAGAQRNAGESEQDGEGGIFGVGNHNGNGMRFGDSGSAARFFYCAKASKEDREEGLDDLPIRSAGDVTDRKDGSDGLSSPRAGAGRTNGSRNHHPTVKPTDLMRYLVRLITPPGGTVLDLFAGSGSTGKACAHEGFNAILIEKEAEYCALAERRARLRQGQFRFEATA